MRAVLFVFVCASITAYAKQIEQPYSSPFEPLATLLLALNPSVVKVTPKFTRHVDSQPVMSGKVGSIYAEALYDAAESAGKVDKVRSDVLNIRAMYNVPEMRSMLEAPTVQVSRDKKKTLALDLFEKIFGASGAIDPLTSNIVKMLIDRNRMAALPSIVDYFEDKYRAGRGIVIVKVTTAAPLSEDRLSSIAEALKIGQIGADKTPMFATKIDEELLGGAILEWQGKVLDRSIKTQLQRIREQMTKGLRKNPAFVEQVERFIANLNKRYPFEPSFDLKATEGVAPPNDAVVQEAERLAASIKDGSRQAALAASFKDYATRVSGMIDDSDVDPKVAASTMLGDVRADLAKSFEASPALRAWFKEIKRASEAAPRKP